MVGAFQRRDGRDVHPARAQRGFTLIETLVVVTVLAVMMAVGLPSFTDFMRNQRVKNASFDLLSTLVLARSEAISRNAAVTVAQTGGNWTNGWTVTDAGGTVIRSQEAISNITITGPASVVYRGNGRLSAALAPIQLTATGASVITRCITIDLSGRPVTKAAAC